MHVFSSIRNRIRLGWSAGTQSENGASTVGKGHDIFHIRILSHTSNGIVGINGAYIQQKSHAKRTYLFCAFFIVPNFGSKGRTAQNMIEGTAHW